jgi:amino acid transporter
VSGSSVRIPQITHGKIVGIYFALVIWISYVALMVVETQAVVQYVSYFYPFMVHQDGGLSTSGYMLAAIIMLILAVLNSYSVKWLIHCNTFFTIIKIVVPVGLSLVFIWFFFSFEQVIHPAGSGFAPSGLHGILVAISSGGVIFSFNAFKQAAELAGEAKRPNFSIPFAIVGSIVICIIIFLLLQIGFLSVLNPANLSHGWGQLDLANNNCPFASVIKQSKILWLLPILFFAAIISPFAAGLMYCTGGARSLFGIAANGCAPKIFLTMNKRMIPFYPIWLNFIFGMIIFLFFKGWDAIATFLTCLFAFSYAVAPVCMVALRFQFQR